MGGGSTQLPAVPRAWKKHQEMWMGDAPTEKLVSLVFCMLCVVLSAWHSTPKPKVRSLPSLQGRASFTALGRGMQVGTLLLLMKCFNGGGAEHAAVVRGRLWGRSSCSRPLHGLLRGVLLRDAVVQRGRKERSQIPQRCCKRKSEGALATSSSCKSQGGRSHFLQLPCSKTVS